MQDKILREIIEEIGGKQAGDILDILSGKKDVNEFLIAKKVKLTINQVRNIFYKLANFGLVSFSRKKDKRKGWYTYFWTLNTDKTLELLEARLNKEVSSLEHQLKSREEKRFYICKTCRTELTEETALLHNFTCPECGEVYELNTDEKILAVLKARIAKAERQKVEVLKDLAEINSKKKKKIRKQESREKSKKKAEREKRKKAKNKELDKIKKAHALKLAKRRAKSKAKKKL